MRAGNLLAFALFGVAVLSSRVYASDASQPGNRFTTNHLQQIERALVDALGSGIAGAEADAAQTLRDVKANSPGYSFSLAVIPLMRLLKDDEANSSVRQLAALALHDLKSSRGDFAILREGKFTQDAKLRRLCRWLGYSRTQESEAIVPPVSGNADLALILK